jgi:hypothetical protein
MTTTQQITTAARNAGWDNANDTLVAAVLNGTAMIATAGAGVTPALANFILRSAGRFVPDRYNGEMD